MNRHNILGGLLTALALLLVASTPVFAAADPASTQKWIKSADPQRPIPGRPPQNPQLPDASLVVIPIAVVSACVFVLCLAYIVQQTCTGSSVRRGASMNPAKEGWFATTGGKRKGNYLLDRWEEGLRLGTDSSDDGGADDANRPRGVTEDQRREIDDRGGPALAYRFVPNADIGPLRDTNATGEDDEEAPTRALFDINDPFDDVLNWGGVSVHEGKSITFRKWSERCAVADLPLYNPNPHSECFYFEAMLSLVGPDTAWVEAHRVQQAQAASLQQAQALSQALAASAALASIPDVDVPPEGYDRSQYDNNNASATENTVTSPTSPRSALANVLAHVGLGSTHQNPTSPTDPTPRTATRPRRNSNDSVLSFETVHENDTSQRRRVYIPSTRTIRSLLPTQGDPHVSMAIGVCTRPYPPFLLPGRHFHSVSYVTTSDGAWLSACIEDDFGREVQKVWGLGMAGEWVARQGDTVGVGYHPRRGGVFFTINGRRIPIPEQLEEWTRKKGGDEEDQEPLLSGGASLRDEWAKYFAVEESRFAWYPCIGSTGPGVVLVNMGRDEFLWSGSHSDSEFLASGGPTIVVETPASPTSVGAEAGPSGERFSFDIFRRPIPQPSTSSSSSEQQANVGSPARTTPIPSSPGINVGSPNPSDVNLPIELRRAYLQDPTEVIDAALDNVRILNPHARSLLSRAKSPMGSFPSSSLGNAPPVPPPDYDSSVPATDRPVSPPRLLPPNRARTPRMREEDEVVRGHKRSLSGTPAPDPPGERVSLQVRKSIEDFGMRGNNGGGSEGGRRRSGEEGDEPPAY